MRCESRFPFDEAESFVDYKLKAPASKIRSITMRGKDGKTLLLSNLVIDTDTTWDGENKLVIQELEKDVAIDVGRIAKYRLWNNAETGDVFDSNYIRIEDILSGNLNVTVKKGQPIWPEWTGENTAEDIGGRKYERVDGVWYNRGEAPEPQPLPDDAVAA